MSGRLYQTLPPRLAPIGGTSSPRNLWATVLYAWLRGTSWVTAKPGFEVIAVPFAASAELWRRLLYGTTADGRVEPGTAKASRNRKLEARDRWLYQQCCARVPYKAILSQLKNLGPGKGWQRLGSIQGIRKAARSYAKLHDLPYPAPRQQI
jgi:hypothetical protein